MPLFTRDQLQAPTGKRKSRSLFRELTTPENRHGAIFVMNKFDREGLPSLYRLYMTYAVNDPTEYQFAMAVFGDFAYWEWLRGMDPVKGMVADWECEAEVARKSAMLEHILEATKDPKTSLQASKYLLERGFEHRPSQTGVDKRKSRAESKELTKDILLTEGYQSDLARLQAKFDS